MLTDKIDIPVAVLEQKFFYKPPSANVPELSGDKRKERIRDVLLNYNFDCPEAIEWDRFENALTTLISFKPAKVPNYDSKNQVRYFHNKTR